MNNNLGKLLVELREKKGYTQKDLADKLNISDKAISRWETGNSIPHVDTLVRISRLFKINLQDLIIAAASTDDNDDNLVKDIIKEFTKRDENKSKIIKIILAITLVVILVLTITIIFTKTYNRFKVYNVYIESDDFYPSNGSYVETKIKDSLFIPNIKIRNYEIKNTDTLLIDLYYVDNGSEYLLQTFTNSYNVYFVNYESYIPIDDLSNYKDQLYIRVKIIDSKNKEYEYVGKLRFLLDFSNNKIFYNDNNIKSKSDVEITNLSKEEIIDRLLANGFEKINDAIYERKIVNGYIRMITNSNIVNIYFEEKQMFYKYTYKINNKLLYVSIVNKNNVEIENYKYDVQKDKVTECITGSCKGYDKAMKFLDENILNLLK